MASPFHKELVLSNIRANAYKAVFSGSLTQQQWESMHMLDYVTERKQVQAALSATHVLRQYERYKSFRCASELAGHRVVPSCLFRLPLTPSSRSGVPIVLGQ